MDKQIICRVRDINHAIAELERQFLRQFNVSINEAMLLCTLREKGELSSGALAESLGLSASNASKIIASSEKKNLISRIVCKDDKRQMFFSLTSIGKEKIETMFHQLKELKQ